MRAETTLNLGCGQQMLGFPPSQSARGSAGAHPVEIGFSLADASAALSMAATWEADRVNFVSVVGLVALEIYL